MLVTINKHLVTGVAQRQRAGLITLRSYDRNVLPVSRGTHSSPLTPPLHDRQGVIGTACPPISDSHRCIKALEQL